MKLKQVAKDIWITNEPVRPHTDSTADGMLTYGLILINTGYVLVYGGKRVHIPVGSIYEIDGRKQHSTEGHGALALLVWDMPAWTVDDFIRELKADPRFNGVRNFHVATKSV